MKACCGVELQLRSFLAPTQCYVEVTDQICYPAALTVGKGTPTPIGFEAGVKGGVAEWVSCGVATESRVEMAASLVAK
jgi:hypothetical protein